MWLTAFDPVSLSTPLSLKGTSVPHHAQISTRDAKMLPLLLAVPDKQNVRDRSVARLGRAKSARVIPGVVLT